MKTDFFQSSGHCWVFQICCHIECSILTASPLRIEPSVASLKCTFLYVCYSLTKSWQVPWLNSLLAPAVLSLFHMDSTIVFILKGGHDEAHFEKLKLTAVKICPVTRCLGGWPQDGVGGQVYQLEAPSLETARVTAALLPQLQTLLPPFPLRKLWNELADFNLLLQKRALWWLGGKESACRCRRYSSHGSEPWVGKISWRKKWQPAPLFLPGKFHGQRSLVGGYGPWGHKESNTIKHSTVCYPSLESGSGRCTINSFYTNTYTYEVVTIECYYDICVFYEFFIGYFFKLF